MIRFENVPPEVMQAMCTPMHPILTPSSSHHPSTPVSPHPSSSSSSSGGTLYLGSLAALSDVNALRAARITHLVQILDVPWLPPLQQQGFICYQIKIDDTDDETKVDLRRYLKDATNWIEGVMRQGGGVLVHCQQGISRSPAIVIAFLMRFRSMSYDAAFSYTMRCRACIKPNSAFIRALHDWEGITGTAGSSVGFPADACMSGHGGVGTNGHGSARGPGSANGYKLQLPPGKIRGGGGGGTVQGQQNGSQQQQHQQPHHQQQHQQQAGPPIVTRPPMNRRFTS